MSSLLRTTTIRWAAAIAAWSLALALLLFASFYWRTASFMRSHLQEEVRAELAYMTERPAEANARIGAWLGEDFHAVRFAASFAPNGDRLSGNVETMPSDLPADGRIRRVRSFVRSGGSARHDELWAAAFGLSDGRTILVAHDTDEVDRAQTTVLDALLFALAPTLALSIAGGLVLAHRARRRLVATEAVLARLMAGDLRQRLPIGRGDDAVDRLARHVNVLLDRIESLFAEVRTVGDALAHDLRTPLTRVRTRLERGGRSATKPEEFRALHDEAIALLDGALAMMDAVLRIGELEHRQRGTAFGLIDLASVARAVAELYEPLADEKAIVLRADLAPVAPVTGDRDLIFEALANFLDNAVKFTPAGGTVVISLRQTRENGTVVAVADNGPGISERDEPRLFRRFHRGEEARNSSGHGLGLSLVAAIAKLHGLTITVSRAPHEGACFALAWPGDPSHAPEEDP